METKQHYEIPTTVTVGIKLEGVICGSQDPQQDPFQNPPFPRGDYIGVEI